MQAYLRQSVLNRIRDEVRRVARRPPPVELPDDLIGEETSPLDHAIKKESYERYCAALDQLKPRDRELVVAHVELQWTTREIQKRFEISSDAATRMAVKRALERLLATIHNRGQTA
jgi:RNA polymerase sigma factor (sigma-70 family)